MQAHNLAAHEQHFSAERPARQSSEPMACGPDIQLDAEETRQFLELVNRSAPPAPALVQAIKAARSLR